MTAHHRSRFAPGKRVPPRRLPDRFNRFTRPGELSQVNRSKLSSAMSAKGNHQRNSTFNELRRRSHQPSERNVVPISTVAPLRAACSMSRGATKIVDRALGGGPCRRSAGQDTSYSRGWAAGCCWLSLSHSTRSGFPAEFTRQAIPPDDPQTPEKMALGETARDGAHEPTAA